MRRLGIVLVLLAVVTSAASAQEGSCSDVLLVKNLTALESSSTVEQYFYRLVDESNYARVKHSAGADYFGVFGASYSDFEERKKRRTENAIARMRSEDALSALDRKSVV